MGLMDRFLCRRETEFAEKLAEKILRKYPPASVPAAAGKSKRPEAVLESLMKEIDAFRTESRPGWLGTAKLGNTLRWKFVDSGYSKDVVEDLTAIVLRRVMMR